MSKASTKKHKSHLSSTGEPALRIVVAGAGAMALQHIRAIRSLNTNVAIVGVVDPAEDARLRALEFAPTATEGIELGELLSRVEADVVHICTPMETHAAVATKALNAGCHIYVEKPVTTRADELSPLLALATRHGLKVCAGHQVLFEHPYRRLVELLSALGKVVHAESYFSFRPVRTTSGRSRPLTHAEQLVDVLPHPTYLLLDLLERVVPTGASELGSLEVTPYGTVHGLVRRGQLTGSLVVSLEARPVEHWLRVVGTNGSIHADFVRGSVQELLGPGTSGIDKALNPFRLSSQLAFRTVSSLGRRIMSRGGSYSGLEEIFSAFYRSIRKDQPSPTSQDQIRATVQVCDEVRQELERMEPRASLDPSGSSSMPSVLVTGGTGLLGREVVMALRRMGVGVRVLARRLPPGHARIAGTEYLTADLADDLLPELFSGITRVIHCAAETSGGWEAHQRNSIDATEGLLRAAASAGVGTFVHISSVAVLDTRKRGPLSDNSPLHPEPKKLGPYTWGKLESERIARSLAPDLGIDLRVVRPVPLVDQDNYSPPGRLGRRIGNLYVAVGRSHDPLVVARADASARAVVAAALMPCEVPEVMNLVPADIPTRRDLVRRLRETNPEVRILWLPRFALYPLSWAATAFQKLLRPRRPAVRLARAFSRVEYKVGPAERWMSEKFPRSHSRREVVRAS